MCDAIQGEKPKDTILHPWSYPQPHQVSKVNSLLRLVLTRCDYCPRQCPECQSSALFSLTLDTCFVGHEWCRASCTLEDCLSLHHFSALGQQVFFIRVPSWEVTSSGQLTLEESTCKRCLSVLFFFFFWWCPLLLALFSITVTVFRTQFTLHTTWTSDNLIQWQSHSYPGVVIFQALVDNCAFLSGNCAFPWIEHGIFGMFNSTRFAFQNTHSGETKIALNRVGFKPLRKRAISIFRSVGLDIVLFYVVKIFDTFYRSFLVKKRVFVKTSCSPRDPPNDLRNVKNSPEPPTIDEAPKMGSKPTDSIRFDSVQSGATPCEVVSPFWDITLSIQSGVTVLRAVMACVFVCQNIMFFPVPWPDGSITRRLERVSTQSCSVPFLVATCHLGFFFNLVSPGIQESD